MLADSEALLAQTREVYQLELEDSGYLSFEGICDISDALERAERQGILSGEALLEVATTLAGARQLRRTLEDRENRDRLPVLNQLVADLRTYPELEQAIHHCIDEQGEVADRASEKLAGLRQRQRQIRDQIYQTLQRILQRQGQAVQESVIAQRGDRFVLLVKATHKDAIPGIVHDASTSGATLYVEPHKVVQAGNQLRQLQRQVQSEEEAIRQQLTLQVTDVTEDLERLLAIVTTLDLAAARARYSTWLQANPPRFIDPSQGERTTLRQLRHPLLVWQQQHEQGQPVVPIDATIQPEIRVVAITGPNTGGKTVTLKTLGLAALMAKVGLFIPAREPVELPWFQAVLADIGDEQSLEQNLSTFSGHVHRISRIVDEIDRSQEDRDRASLVSDSQEESEAQNSEFPSSSSPTSPLSPSPSSKPLPLSNVQPTHPITPSPHHPTQNSKLKISPAETLRKQNSPAPFLILLDEIGAGTDPSEGSALAIALLQYLADRVQLTVATTHFGELKMLKYQDERFENASVEFDDASLSPTYRLLWGIPGRSNALIIARRLGLDGTIPDRAQQLIGSSSSEDINQMIAGLENQRRDQETKNQTAAQLLQQAERLHAELAQRAARLQEREQALKQEQEQAIQAAIAEARQEIAQVIRRLQRGTTTAKDAQQATENLNRIAQAHLPSAQTPPKPPPAFSPQVGDRVRIPRLGKTAEVIDLPDRTGELTVRFGLMKMTVNLADVESLDGKKAELPAAKPTPASAPTPAPPDTLSAPAVRTERNTLDIRGSRVADAEPDIEGAIADLTRSGHGTLWIIHGRGTGRLRQGVQEFLDRHPQVQRHELAEKSQGGSGVTVAYLQ